ncbi:hypothetical protein ACM66B_007051 [Microbotryomycetes sp. NB124-2]
MTRKDQRQSTAAHRRQSETDSRRSAAAAATYESFTDLVHTKAHSNSPRAAQRNSNHSPASPSWPSSPVLAYSSGNRAADDDDMHKHHTSSAYTSRGWISRLLQGNSDRDDNDNDNERDLSSLNLMALTVGLAGAQLTWTVEMAFGTPYLLSLGLSKTGTSLVWLAGPLSGLLVQPMIGAISDSSQSRYRRRAFIAGSAALVILSTLLVAYAREIGSLLASWSGLGDWDPKQEDTIKHWAIVVGVSGFYILDFSLNGLQATLRALILDRSPGHQQPVANAWHGRMTHLGNIFGYLAGYIDLGHWSGIRWVGGGQFRKLAVLSCIVMAGCVTVTCWTQPEKEHIDAPNGVGVKWTRAWSNIKHTIRHLPKPVRQVCYVQFCAWTAWFPFLFYSTSYVTEVLYSTIPPRQELPSADTATRAGSRALLLYAIVALCSGAFLPWLTTLGNKRLINSAFSRTTRKGRFVRTVLTLLTPRNFWSFGLLLYFVGMCVTFFVKDVAGATAVIAFLGIPWAINCWVPFALVMECVRDLANEEAALAASADTTDNLLPSYPSTPTRSTAFDRGDGSASKYGSASTRPFRTSIRQQPSLIGSPSGNMTPTRTGVESSGVGRAAANRALTECSPLIAEEGRHSSSSRPKPTSLMFATPTSPHNPTSRTKSRTRQASTGSIATSTTGTTSRNKTGATILGIHNLSIVAPQFVVAIVAALIFKLLDSGTASQSKAVVNFALDVLVSNDNEGQGGGGGGGGDDDARNQLRGKNDVVWVLRFGGLVSLIGVWVSRFLVETTSERLYKAKVLSWYEGEEDVRGVEDSEEEEGEQHRPFVA